MPKVSSQGDAEGKEAKEGDDEGVPEGQPAGTDEGPTTIETDQAAQQAQVDHDLKSRGVWPIAAGKTPCAVLEGPGFARWREYQWCVQKYVDRKGVPQEKKVQVFQDRTGSRQEFLATYRRKILEWLPHRQHLEWDRMWQGKQYKSRSSSSSYSSSSSSASSSSSSMSSHLQSETTESVTSEC